jgi:hypothetical protein
MQKAGFSALLITVFSLGIAGTAQADRSEGEATARKGVVRCGGSNHLRQGGTEIHTTNYNLRNFDPAQPVTIDRLRFFDATGAVLFDSAGGGLPPADNGVLGPANNVLNPNQTAQFRSNDILPFLQGNARPIQAEIEWSASKDALTLAVGITRLVRRRDPATGAVQEERARSSSPCRSIFLK